MVEAKAGLFSGSRDRTNTVEKEVRHLTEGETHCETRNGKQGGPVNGARKRAGKFGIGDRVWRRAVERATHVRISGEKKKAN